MTTILVWYFLAGGYGSSVSVAGPFATQDDCVEMNKWAFQYKYTSRCYQAPLAAPQALVEDCHAKRGCK